MADFFDAKNALEVIRAKKKMKRRWRLRKSRLDPVRGEVLALDRDGASLSEIKAWLDERKIVVERTTVWHFLKKNRAL